MWVQRSPLTRPSLHQRWVGAGHRRWGEPLRTPLSSCLVITVVPVFAEVGVFTGSPSFIVFHRCCLFYKSKAKPFTSTKITAHFIYGGLEPNLNISAVRLYSEMGRYYKSRRLFFGGAVWGSIVKHLATLHCCQRSHLAEGFKSLDALILKAQSQIQVQCLPQHNDALGFLSNVEKKR